MDNVGSQFNVDEKKGLSIHHFLIKGLQNLLWIENYLAYSMTEMIKTVASEDLKKTIQDNLGQTNIHVMRLEKVFEVLKEEPKSVESKAVTDILKQVGDIISKTKDESDVRDIALIMLIHKIKRYEITAYSNPVEASKLMEFQDVWLLLNANLEEEKSTVEKLSTLLDNSLNQITSPCKKVVTQNNLLNKK